MTTMTRQERWTHKAQVREYPCRVCRNRIDTGERAFGRVLYGCAEGHERLPKRGMCEDFNLDEDV